MDSEFFKKWDASHANGAAVHENAGWAHDNGAHQRYKYRTVLYQTDGRKRPRLRHHFYWLLHNCVAHPILGVFINRHAVEFHELTSKWLNKVRPVSYGRGTHTLDIGYSMPKVKKKGAWFLHNCVVHPLIGLLPFAPFFFLHDWSAKVMNVKGWV